jgi:CTD kinase subunit beta
MAHEGENGPARPASSAEANGSSAGASTKVGPHPGFIFSSNQYSSETKVRRMLKENGCDPAREDNYRLQGVQLIDNVRKHLNLYVHRVFFVRSMLMREFFIVSGKAWLTDLQAGADV